MTQQSQSNLDSRKKIDVISKTLVMLVTWDVHIPLYVVPIDKLCEISKKYNVNLLGNKRVFRPRPRDLITKLYRKMYPSGTITTACDFYNAKFSRIRIIDRRAALQTGGVRYSTSPDGTLAEVLYDKHGKIHTISPDPPCGLAAFMRDYTEEVSATTVRQLNAMLGTALTKSGALPIGEKSNLYAAPQICENLLTCMVDIARYVDILEGCSMKVMVLPVIDTEIARLSLSFAADMWLLDYFEQIIDVFRRYDERRRHSTRNRTKIRQLKRAITRLDYATSTWEEITGQELVKARALMLRVHRRVDELSAGEMEIKRNALSGI